MNLDNLPLTQGELEQLTGCHVSDGVVGGAWRFSVLRQPHRLLSFITTQLLLLAVLLILVLPMTLLVGRNSGTLANDGSNIGGFLLVAILIAGAIALLVNLYMGWRAKYLKLLINLLHEVDQYNEIIAAIKVADQLSAIRHSTADLANRDRVIEAMNVTRESLVCALMTEKILRQNRQLIARRHELFGYIERNLATVESLQSLSGEANEYSELLNDALAVSMSIRQELETIATATAVRTF